MFPYPSGVGPARRPPRGLHRDRHRRALQAHARASTCCTRWAGTPSACPPSSTRSRPARTRATTTRAEHRHLQAPAQDAGLQLRLVARGRHHRSRATCAGRSGSSCSSSSTASRTRRGPGQLVPGARHRARQRGGRSTARASAAVIRSCARRCGSGCCGSPPTPIGSPRTSTLLDWPEARCKMQRDWIGRSEGAEIDVRASTGTPARRSTVFTTRPDTLFGATYMVLAPEHPLVAEITTPSAARRGRRVRRGGGAQERPRPHARSRRRRPACSPARYAINPVTGAQIPIWIADYVLGGYGTGAIMAVPGARRARLRVRQAVRPADRRGREPRRRRSTTRSTRPYTGDGVAVRSGEFDGLSTAEVQARRSSTSSRALGSGARKVNYKLRDWVFSRQRYWGEPIPIYFPVELATAAIRATAPRTRSDYDQPHRGRRVELPLRLPELDDFSPGDDPRGPARARDDWRFFQKDGQLVRARDQHDAAVGGLVLVLPALPRSAERRRAAGRPEAYDALDAGRPLRRRRRARGAAPALRALLAQGALRPRAS